jgi:hypothetical protein
MPTLTGLRIRLHREPAKAVARCPYCNQADPEPKTHISGGRCEDTIADALDGNGHWVGFESKDPTAGAYVGPLPRDPRLGR